MKAISKKILSFLKKEGISVDSNYELFKVFDLNKKTFYYIFQNKIEIQKVDLYILTCNPNLKIISKSSIETAIKYEKSEKLIEIEKTNSQKGKLVWFPSKISFSPFYPFWQIKLIGETFFFDKNNNVFKESEINNTLPG